MNALAILSLISQIWEQNQFLLQQNQQLQQQNAQLKEQLNQTLKDESPSK